MTADHADKHVVVVGAGPGGLTAAMILARKGFKVTVFEKRDAVGGRNSELVLGDYRFDVGPTFLMMRFLLDEVFEETGRRSSDYLDFVDLEPMYALDYGGTVFHASSDRARLAAEVERVFPGSSGQLDAFFKKEETRFRKMYPCLQRDYSSAFSMMAPVLLKALPHLDIGKSMYDVLASYFEQDDMRISFTFQSKYLGMSPWTCPAAFMIIPYIEYGWGVYHVQGGLTRISHAMAKVVEEEGGAIRLNAPVARVLVEGREARGVELEDGTKIAADAVVLNADFGHAMSTLFEPGVIRKWTGDELRRRPYSCSTFMLYLGVDKTYPMAHHTIYFSRDYRRYVDDVTERKVLSDDLSFYVRNATVTDPGIAPPGHSALYVLVPIANNASGIDWEKEAGPLRERLLDLMVQRTPMKDLKDHIVEEAVITPLDWERERDVFLGATFNLAHTVTQMLYFRPRNAFEEVDRCYLVGGGTHPGSGLPTIYESGRISAHLVCERFGAPVDPPKPPPPPKH